MRLPRSMARFNRLVTNRVQGLWAPILPPWIMLHHRGRRSGRTYRTPMLASRRHGRLTIPVLYGPESDWVRNVVASGRATVVRGGRTFTANGVRLQASADATGWPARIASHVVIADLVRE